MIATKSKLSIKVTDKIYRIKYLQIGFEKAWVIVYYYKKTVKIKHDSNELLQDHQSTHHIWNHEFYLLGG